MNDDGSRGTDLALVQRFLRSRGEDAFRALYRAHTPGLYGLALRLTGGDQPEAEDLVQECWVRAVRSLESFRAESALRTWLCGFLVNARRERIRNAWRTVDLLDADSPVPAGTDGSPVDLERAIAALPPGARDVFVLHDVQGYTHREIAMMLEIATGTSKSQLTRARALLRTSLYAEGRS